MSQGLTRVDYICKDVLGVRGGRCPPSPPSGSALGRLESTDVATGVPHLRMMRSNTGAVGNAAACTSEFFFFFRFRIHIDSHRLVPNRIVSASRNQPIQAEIQEIFFKKKCKMHCLNLTIFKQKQKAKKKKTPKISHSLLTASLPVF